MKLLVCTDLDRTLIPNGAAPESPDARKWFGRLVKIPGIALAYVTGRDLALVTGAIKEYRLPVPDFVLADVGASIYVAREGSWQQWRAWQQHIAPDWKGLSGRDLAVLLDGISTIELQEKNKQGTFKLSYYAPLDTQPRELLREIEAVFARHNIKVDLVWSIDEPAGVGLLDILPARAGKKNAVEFVMASNGYGLDSTIFCGDSGNDLPVFAGPVASVVVNNASNEVKAEARKNAARNNTTDSLYLATGGFRGMNGNYAAGILEGVCFFHQEINALLEL
ncbi:HAD-IIB family hydrolase [Desulforhopalus singaporensis]|uniref:Sucrose phosphatase-like domain-containing protein n=1 Tax=Desulforhopalus singaporensis TaxID=91360 RepID=A0A1H0TBQ0_9BACT|nr:HAD-IIB family hydrolase [Desulforhopalus singaporensis]SDP51457.1 hypothetical protein SAMN05660330_03010 [Desulforhopalus singaporensis]